jgi:hypothetical protein
MVSRRRIALAVLSTISFLPLAAQAGAGGSPTAPGAGKGTEYCCEQPWKRMTLQTDDGKTITVWEGNRCRAITEDELGRNSCQGTVAKCRGEFFTPGPSGTLGRVDRCFTP